jgi:hypothetical protein
VDWDPWADPWLIECLCPRCQRGKQCSYTREKWARWYEAKAYREQCAALTPDDVAWLESMGWSCPEPLQADRDV